MRQGLGLEPLLQAISDFLDDQQDMIEQIRSDLVRGLENAATGRSGLTPQQVLRSLVLMRGKNWRYRELRERIADGYTLRHSRTSILGGCRGMMHSTAASPG
jgi:IS5 family transposase